MGTNYYARIIPKEEDIKSLHKLIDINDFKEINNKINELYNIFEPHNNEDKPTGVIHLGKRSGGWKFLWNPNIYIIRNGHSEKIPTKGGYRYDYIPEPDTPYYIYPLTKKGIKNFIDREDIKIYNEYDEEENKEEFFKMALDWTTWDEKEAYDSDSYHLTHPEEKVWNCVNEYTRFLENLGYKLSKNKSDFYSDGLRFSTATYFC